jgi:thiol-disulfide isomerase/thioredoxin
MVHIKRQQIFVLFVLAMLFGAWFVASALTSSFQTQQPKQQLVFDTPLSNSDEAVFLQQNKVVAKYFWSANCTICPDAETAVDNLFQEFGGNLVIEKIDVDKWPDVAQEFDVVTVPALELKGNTIKRVENISSNNTFNEICDLFFQPVDQCAPFG